MFLLNYLQPAPTKLAGTNLISSEIEKKQIRNLLISPKDDLMALDDKTICVETTLAKLQVLYALRGNCCQKLHRGYSCVVFSTIKLCSHPALSSSIYRKNSPLQLHTLKHLYWCLATSMVNTAWRQAIASRRRRGTYRWAGSAPKSSRLLWRWSRSEMVIKTQVRKRSYAEIPE